MGRLGKWYGFKALLAALAVGTTSMSSLAGSALAATVSFLANPSSLGAIPDGTGVGPIEGGPPACGEEYGVPRDVTFNVTGISGTISDVSVGLGLNPPHTWVGDLDVVLVAPSGESKTIFSGTGVGQPCGYDSVVAGPYGFTDAAPASPTWWEAAAASSPIPTRAYRASAAGGF